MTRVALLVAALGLAVAGGCRSDAPRETRRDPPGPLGRLVDWPLPGNFPAFDRVALRDGGALWATFDLDGDGRPDLVRTHDEARTGPSPWVLHRNTGAGFDGGTEWAVPEGGYPDLGFATADCQAPGLVDGADLWRTVDVDGDGRPELVITGVQDGFERRALGGPDAAHWRVHRNLGDGFAAEATAWPLDAAAANVARGQVDVGTRPADEARGHLFDLDGDGLPDLVATTALEGFGPRQVPGYGEGEPRWRFLRNTGEGFAPAVGWPVPDLNRGPEPLGGLHAPEAADLGLGGVNWTLADLDGDRRPDLVVLSAPGLREVPGLAAGEPHWEVYANTGSGFEPTPRRHAVPALASAAGPTGPFSLVNVEAALWALLDFDGDGKADLLQTGVARDGADPVPPGFPEAPAWLLHRHEGGGFAAVGTTVGLPDGGLDVAGFLGARQDDVKDLRTEAVHSWRTVDVDGDGRVDLLWSLSRSGALGTDDQVLGMPESPRWLVSFQRPRP